ncbi:hypothetical protein LSTR_LSTR001432 [Laodelphax striatellus]|uniref:Metalloendopeptidase n=1 Tax=Laodelphax striatellus TaxID=195883 RepID=A0A482XAC0_LAOST|nr:hypothetical protein LSTR_LSTR001432 [Laodelphax striatellus]
MSFVTCQVTPPPPKHNGESFMMQKLYMEGVDRAIASWHPSRNKQNVWELSGLYEGDIMMPSSSGESERNAILDDTLRWHEGVVPYHISDDFDDDEKEVIMGAMDEFHQKSCIKFRPYEEGDDAYVVVRGNNPGCWSYVGRRGGGQVVNLRGRCVQHGVAVHELLHAVGFHHQQSAADRDDFVKIHWQNIVPRTRGNFRKYSPFKVTDFNVGYDYDSVMHYSSHAFSKNGKKTITPLDEGANIGQRSGMSDKDQMKLNIMYKCDSSRNRPASSSSSSFSYPQLQSFWDSPFDFSYFK